MAKKLIFDYIIIGGGTAGGVLAKKLTDSYTDSVLVLEAGQNRSDELSSASITDASLHSVNNRYSFQLFTNLEEQLDRSLLISGGRVIGGSSETNSMFAVRGSQGLFDRWEALTGAPWGYQEVYQLFRENETYTGLSQTPALRGYDGPIKIRQQNIPEKGINQILAQAISTVYEVPVVEDYNTGIGGCAFSKTQFTQSRMNHEYLRSSTATGYLNDTIVTQGDLVLPDEYGMHARRLVIFTRTTVNRILFQNRFKIPTACGVEYIRNGITQRAYARKGVILSAGIFSSVILQRSGIGSREVLEAAGVTTIVDNLNVGRNFMSHFDASMGIEVKTERLLSIMDADPDMPISLGAFAEDAEGSRRLQLIGIAASSFLPVQEVLINNWQFDNEKSSNIMSLLLIDLNASSRGFIAINTSDPTAYPTVSLNPLTAAEDLEFMVDQFIKVSQSFDLAREADPEGIYRFVYPPENIFTIPDLEEKRRILSYYIKASYSAAYHYGGQCRMALDSKEGVTDGYLNVFGTANLKVADLSVSPILPDGNTAVPSQMIALNAARFLQSESTYVFSDNEFESV
ncbi:GMC family oxidoreductase [Anaerocolumna sp. AGMB13020]|uniref:GMC family oxidoreductase n=1 Tax=Anaerocolumna sp. AGMB13020 TaxID=3081750 RepID=UPI0029550378|nr:GMC family oxidoreductase [Anaerocolumna sp. AGMB13020]WOO36855.1 GMC family oxidoreductase [Anaerocolumna sp. AGMB13020]